MPTIGVHNFRDFGGYRALDGGTITKGKLYRSGEHAHSTESDMVVIRALKLSAIVDLRGRTEREKSPSHYPTELTAKVICPDGETAVVAPHVDAASNALSAMTARKNMCDQYSGLPFRPVLIDVYRQYFQAVQASTHATLVHCTAGKDRTGLLVALLHTALGVHSSDIFEDYLLTNSVGDVSARVEALTQDLKRFFGNVSDEAVRVITSVEPAFLQASFDAITSNCGSVDAYLEEILGVNASTRVKIASHLIAQ